MGTENKKSYRIPGVLEEAKLILVEKIKAVLACKRVGAGINGEGHGGIFSGDVVVCMLVRLVRLGTGDALLKTV